MSIIYEAAESPDLADDSYKLIYNVLETSTAATARGLVAALAPLAVLVGAETLVRQNVHVKTNGGVDCWKGTVDYGPEDEPESQQRPEPGTWKASFDTTGGRHTITQAQLISRHWTNHFGEAPSLQGAINWDGQTVKGVEIVVPAFKFQITAYYNASDVTTGFAREIARKTARVNSDAWLGFEPGELLYFGGQGEVDVPTVAGQRVKPVAIKHYFEASENAILAIDDFTQSDPAGVAGQVPKKGWEYFWTWFKKRKDEDFSKVVPRPAYGYVHDPYPTKLAYADFFGFGGP